MRTTTLLTFLLAASSLLAGTATAQGYDCAAQDEIPQTGCEALVALYDATDGDNWTDNTGWLSEPIAGWFGVRVENGRVVELTLPENGLFGEIPPELGDLDQLQMLNLNDNQLTGVSPPELGNLALLEELSLGVNRLSSTIPSELGNLTELTRLYLSGQDIHGEIPSELGNLTKLIFLTCSEANLTGTLPPELGNLTELNEMHFGNNQLTGPIPPEYGNLTGLRILLLFNNQLSGPIPNELGTLTLLEELELQSNMLTGEIPASLGNLAALQELVLFDNQLGGPLPSTLGNLTNLVRLEMQGNALSGALPPALGNLANLNILSLFINDLTGPIPPEIGNLTNLTWLDLGDNDFNGTLPSTLANLSQLVGLFVGGNNLEGTTPIGDLRLLEEVWLHNNHFDQLPDLGNLSALRVLWVNNNRLTFEDLEPNVGIPTEVFDYGDQALVGTARSITVDEGAPLMLSLAVGGANNQYQWFKDGAPIAGATQDTYALAFATAEDAGVYTLQITNPTVPDLTLGSEPITVSVSEEPPFSQAYPLSVQPATYRMVSIPLDLTDASVQAVLEDDLGTYDPQAWRLFRWNESRDDYDEYPEFTATFTPGTAFWLITSDGTGFDVDAANTVHQGRSYSITLAPGWNQIGSPFPFEIAWDSVQGTEGVETPVRFDGAEYQYNQTLLAPWAGYFVYNTNSDPVTLDVPPVAATPAQKRAPPRSLAARAGYAVQLLASEENHGLRSTQTFVGFAEEATTTRDALDVTGAPGIGDFLRVAATDTGEELAASFKPLSDEGQWWDVEVEAVIERELIPLRKHVKITVAEHGMRPPGLGLYVLDRDAARLLATDDGPFTIDVSRNAPVRHLRVIVGTRRFAEQHSEATALVPLDFMLGANYPNPFKQETAIRYQTPERGRVVIEVFNLLGRHVRTLVNRETAPGAHEVVWDGTNDAGQPVASGTYVYRMRTGTFTATRRLLLLR